jgi:DNA-directed RNA polymerase subunit alpha
MTTATFVELIESGKLDQAQQKIDSASPDTLSDVDKKLLTALIKEHQHAWEDASEIYESVIDEDPDNVDGVFRLAYLADLRGDDELAVDLYEQLAAQIPAHTNALLNLAVLYEDMGRNDEALACVDRILDDYPNHKRAQLFKRDIVSSKDMYYDEDRERHHEQRNAVLETPISDFELSVRSRNCLKQMMINTLGDLLRTTPSELLSYKNFGETSLHEIEAMLVQKGLRIGQLLEEKEPDVTGFSVPANADPQTVGMLNRSVAEMELSVRARKCLMRLGVASIGELLSRSEVELLSIKNFGMTSLSEIKRRLAEMGLSLKGG